eukprot:gene3911-13983_t
MDPYYAVKLELDELIQDLKQKLSRYHGLQSGNPERRTLKAQIDAGCESGNLQLGLLNKAVDKASENPERFNLTNEELAGRRRWIDNSKRQVESLQEGTKSAASAPPPPKLPSNASAAQIGESNSEFLEYHRAAIDAMVHACAPSSWLGLPPAAAAPLNQDRTLDDIEAAVGRIGNMGVIAWRSRRGHGRDPDTAERLLGDLGEDMDVTQTRLRVTQKRMQDILKRSGGTKQLCLIIFLVVITENPGHQLFLMLLITEWAAR